MASRARKKPLDPLLQAVLDDPADDAQRLVYADALSERGDPRGEFIVAQMHGRDAIANEEWLGPIAKIVDPTRTAFRRGFVQAVFVKKGPRPAIENTAAAVEWGTIERVAFAKEVGGVVIEPGAHDRVTRYIEELASLDAGLLTSLKVSVSRGLYEGERKQIREHSARAGITGSARHRIDSDCPSDSGCDSDFDSGSGRGCAAPRVSASS